MVQVIAHRGARSLAPENTLLAARVGRESGADLWETDVTVTRDGRLILFHDPTLTRCTDAARRFPNRSSYRVSEFDLMEIQALDAGSWFLEADPFRTIAGNRIHPEILAGFPRQAVPTLEQGLCWTRDHGWTINIELKCHVCGKGLEAQIPLQVLETLRAVGISPDRVVISSFNHDWLRQIRSLDANLEIQALVGDSDMNLLDFGNYEFSAYNVHAALVHPDRIRRLKARGKKINVFTINDPNTFYRFADLGVDGIFTDFPQVFARSSRTDELPIVRDE